MTPQDMHGLLNEALRQHSHMVELSVEDFKGIVDKLDSLQRDYDALGALSHEYRNDRDRHASKLSAANGRADFNETRALEAESRLGTLESALRRIVEGRLLGYVEAQEIAGAALDPPGVPATQKVLDVERHEPGGYVWPMPNSKSVESRCQFCGGTYENFNRHMQTCPQRPGVERQPQNSVVARVEGSHDGKRFAPMEPIAPADDHTCTGEPPF